MKVRMSKRVPVRRRHKIEKASASKQRKQKKAAKNDITWKSKLKKDPGVPNLYPYKDKLIKEFEEGRKRKAEETTRRRELAQAQRSGIVVKDGPLVADEEDDDVLLDLEDEEDDSDGEHVEDSSNPMAALLASARSRAAAFDPANASDAEDGMEDDASEADSFASFAADTPGQKSDNSRKAYAATVNNLIASADILLYVLDARDPLSSRSQAVEQQVLAHPDKRLLFVLNKIDLVPDDALKGWLRHLRTKFPTLPFRSASTAPAAKTFDHKGLTAQTTASSLIDALKAKSASRVSTTVGVLGYPNVGKSSVINALTRRLAGKAPKTSRGCPIGAEAGVTTSLRHVKLDSKLTLVDSPGVVAPTEASKSTKAEEHARLVLLNALPPKDIGDAAPAVGLLLAQWRQTGQLQQVLDSYGLPAIRSSAADALTDFLVAVARARGRLGKGGVANLHAAAQTVLADVRDGRVANWQAPPETGTSAPARADSHDQKTIVGAWAAEFRLDGLWNDAGEADAGVQAMAVD